MDKLFTSFDHMFTSFDHLFTSFGINWSVIWADSSIYVCTWLISMIVLTIWAAKNYRNSVREEYLVKVTSARIAWEQDREKLESENRLLSQSFDEYRNDVQESAIERQAKIDELSVRTDELSAKNNQLSAEVEELSKKVPKRNANGTFAVTTGKGHQRKRKLEPEPERDWTKATKEELLAEAKRRYPVGTKYRSVLFGKKYESKFETEFCIGLKSVWEKVGGTVYSDGKWAKIVK